MEKKVDEVLEDEQLDTTSLRKQDEIQMEKTIQESEDNHDDTDDNSHTGTPEFEYPDPGVPPRTSSSLGPADELTEDLRGLGNCSETGCRSCSTPLRLRRLPASFWQEPNVPKDLGRRPLWGVGKGCQEGSCRSCRLVQNQSFYQKDPQLDYDLLNKYRDPSTGLSISGCASQSGNLFPLTKYGCDPGELVYMDPSPSAWSAAPNFLPLPSIRLGAGAPDLSPSARSNFSATAALYGHVMRRTVPAGYRHGNYGDVINDRLTSSSSSSVADDLWRLVPCRPFADVFSKRYHPYL